MGIGQKLLEILGVFGGITSIITIVSAWSGKVWANKILQDQMNNHNRAMAEISAKLQKDIDQSKNQLDSLKEYSIRYSEHQFKLYTELWSELYSLMIIADELWDNTNQLNLKKFVIQLKQTTNQVKMNALLIEKGHLSELLNLFKELGDYRLGKQTLIEYRDNGTYIDDMAIFQMIDHNLKLKERFSKILNRLEIEFCRQLKYYGGPSKL